MIQTEIKSTVLDTIDVRILWTISNFSCFAQTWVIGSPLTVISKPLLRQHILFKKKKNTLCATVGNQLPKI